jgi:hypothetical protein
MVDELACKNRLADPPCFTIPCLSGAETQATSLASQLNFKLLKVTSLKLVKIEVGNDNHAVCKLATAEGELRFLSLSR